MPSLLNGGGFFTPRDGALAQLVEHLTFNQVVTGSNPVRPTIPLFYAVPMVTCPGRRLIVTSRACTCTWLSRHQSSIAEFDDAASVFG